MATPSCLIAVDSQVGFISPATASIPASVRTFCKTTPIKHRIFTRFINPVPGGTFIEQLGWSNLQDEHEITLAPEAVDIPTLVVDKFAHSPFVDHKLEDTLRELAVDEILVFGLGLIYLSAQPSDTNQKQETPNR